ncbi:unnamed protein product [Closterium sp. NIES-65]|nr:unnamed protein product [Closterium sp. NIES-65]
MKYRRWNRWKEWRAALEGLDDAQPPEARSRRKGRVSRVMHDVEEVEATTPATQDHPMAEEPEDPHEESVDDDVVYEPEGDGIEDEDDWEELCNAKVVGGVDAEATSTPIVASAPPVGVDTEAVKERLIDELMEGEEEGNEEGHAGGQSSSNDPCGEDGSEDEHAPKVPSSRKRKAATGGHVTRKEFEALRVCEGYREDNGSSGVTRTNNHCPWRGAQAQAGISGCGGHSWQGSSEAETPITDAIINWEVCKGKLYNPPYEDGASVRRIQKLAFDAIADVMCGNEVAYDEEKKSWKWGRHGLRLSSCGLECLLEDEASSKDDHQEFDESDELESESDECPT